MTLTRTPSAPDADQMISQALRQTVQVPPEVLRDGLLMGGFGASSPRGAFLPPYGTRQREFALRDLYRMDEMWMIRGAITGLAKNIASLPWEIKGENEAEDPAYGEMARAQGWRLKRSTGVQYFQEVLRQANFGMGWGPFVAQMTLDFLRYDAGGYTEIIAQGASTTSPLGAVTGLSHLDPLRTYPTGDPLFPAVYYDRWGGVHVLHHSRVMRLVDMDDGDELRPGYGDSALSRAVSIAYQQIWQSRYVVQRLDDKPPPGLTIIGGILKAEWDIEQRKYQAQQGMDFKPTYGQRQFYFTPDPSVMPKVESYEFSSPPEKFDLRTYTDVNVDALALAMGVDRQELMQLSGGGALGSGAQSMILAQKSRGKTIGYLLQQIERKMNDILPDEFSFEFKVRDTQESMEDAQKAQIWAGVAVELVASGAISATEARTLVANAVEAVQDAINDAPRANDVDVAPLVAQDDTTGAAPIASAMPRPRVNLDIDEEEKALSVKAYPMTEALFVQEVGNVLSAASTPNQYIRLDRRGFGITMRSILKRYGEQAYRDGLAMGGVTVEALDPEDRIEVAKVFVDQSQYINGLTEDVYGTKRVTPSNAASRAQQWGKSLQQFNDAGMMSADRNGMYEWVFGFSEHCKDCQRLNGQVHRMKTWKGRNFLPRSSKLFCRGYNCKCTLRKSTDKARGRF